MNKRNFMNLRRSFLGALLVMAFMIIGAQQAEAQYLPASDAKEVLNTRIAELNDGPQEKDRSLYTLGQTFRATTQTKASYLSGVLSALEATDNVQTAIDQNHSTYLEDTPAASAIATQYRSQVIQLLED